MFPALYLYYKPALDMYKFEKADGVGRAYDIVLQGYIRFASIALGPVFVAVSVIYLLVSSFVTPPSYSFLICVLNVHIIVNQLRIVQLCGLSSSSSCQHCPEPDLDSSSDCPHLLRPRNSIPSLSNHFSCGGIFQWFLHTHWGHALGVIITMI